MFMDRIRILLIAAAVTASTIIGCGGDDGLVVEPIEVTDPYCVETENWFEELSVSAGYADDLPGAVVVTLAPTRDVVDMDGLVQPSGADFDSVVYDGHTLWLILLPFEDEGEVTLTGAVDCTTETQPWVMTLYLSPDDDTVTYELIYTDSDLSDAGDDAGDLSDAGV